MKRCLVLAALGLCMLMGGLRPAFAFPPGTGRYQQFGDAAGFLNILPSGQDGTQNLQEFNLGAGAYQPHMRDQLSMYADLVYNSPGLTEGELSSFYKDASFGTPDGDIERVYSPTSGVTVVRDRSYGVPHIFGDTRYATMFAQGYTAAEDRLFLMDVLRHLGRARLSEFLGPSASNQALDREQLAVAPYTEADLTAQRLAFSASGPEGQAIADDSQAYTDGVNQYITEALSDGSKLPVEYTLLGLTLDPWVPEDMIAIASKVGAIFGRGGGGEVSNFCGLKNVTAAIGNATTAREVFDDLHFANDAEAVTTAAGSFPYMTNLGPVNPAAHPDIDCSTLTPVIDGGGGFALHFSDVAGTFASHAMSNALLVSAANTVSGHPIAVFGPQTGYFMPQLLVEKDVHGPGIDARGAAFAGVDLYVQLGRGTDYAWSATSSGADNVDQWVLELCEPLGGPATINSMGYMHNSTCVPIETYQHTQATTPAISWRVERTPDYGPISERGTLMDGTPIAIAVQRSTYGNELGSAYGFYRVNDPAKMANGFADFQANMGGGIDFSFNWFYADDAHIGYQHSCKCPQRATGVDPYMPAWGTGAWDWQGYIPLASQPNALDPAQGYLTSWNNKQAPDFMADDRSFSQGPVQRVQMLNTRIEAAIAAGPLDRADLVDAMEDGGTVDLRGQEVLSLLLDVMGPTAPGGVDARAQDMRDRLAAWEAAAAHRRDLNHDGAYDDPQAPAIMDTWWSLLSHAIFDPDSGNAISNLGISMNDAPQGHNGSAFGGGTYSHVQKDLRQVLGLSVTDPFSRTYCGSGVPAACATVLWDALSDAAPLLQAEFGSANVADWKRTVASDEVRSSALGIAVAAPFHWINRPTFQQVVQIGAGCANDSDCDGVTTASDNCGMAANPLQENTDLNFIDQTPPTSQDDRTYPNSDAIGDACDPDDDNDGLGDTTEAGGPPCASASAATNPLLRDTDGDRVLDGPECALGTNPNSAASKPTAAQCGATTDADGDRLSNRAEFCGYSSNPLNTDTDVDQDGFPTAGLTKDGCEAASINGDRVVNSGDQLLMVLEIIREPSPSLRLVSYDVNKDGAVNAGDQLLLAQFISPSGQCP
ncbi:MAG: penicillin acylase family protein [Chloroflexi bacterium]|nr:penicillin acylase family protein [Chloroflexota bacterium]